MPEPDFIATLFIIFCGAGVVATLALYTRQPMIIAYIVVGAVLGPFGLGVIDSDEFLNEIAEIGIIFLLFLIGLDLQPSKLKNMLGESLLTALGTSIIFFSLSAGIMLIAGFNYFEAIVTGLGMTFSSTILAVKLLPTTALHHRHIGEMVISLLLIQDLLAIFAIILVGALGAQAASLSTNLLALGLGLPGLILGAYLAVRFILLPLISKFDAFHEYIFLLTIAWCLLGSSAAHAIGLSYEIGAFIAGVSLATSPIAQYIAEHLKPLRDFFLILFFFTVGASLNLGLLQQVWLPALLLAATMLAVKPKVFESLLKVQGEPAAASKEVGWRLGQASEFSLLLSYIALANGVISPLAGAIMQCATVLTLLVNSSIVVSRFPSPMAANPALRRD